MGRLTPLMSDFVSFPRRNERWTDFTREACYPSDFFPSDNLYVGSVLEEGGMAICLTATFELCDWPVGWDEVQCWTLTMLQV